jgi:LCP family protein required for cell wall assembly
MGGSRDTRDDRDAADAGMAGGAGVPHEPSPADAVEGSDPAYAAATADAAGAAGDRPLWVAVEVDGAAPEDSAATADPAPDAAPVSKPALRLTLIAGALSFLWPGLGQLVIGHRRAAALFTVPALLFVLLAVSQIAPDPFLFAANLLDGDYLSLFILCVVAFGVWRAAAVLHIVYARRPKRRFGLETAVALALVAAIGLMHGAVAAEAWFVYDTSVEVQNNNFLDEAMATPTPEATPTPTPLPTASWLPTASSSPTATPDPTPTPKATPVVNPNRITFLLVGIDFTAGRHTGSTDTLMVVSVDTQTRQAVMLSIPRDTAGFELYYGGFLQSNFKINSLLAGVYNGTVKSPDPPMATLEKEIGYLIGIPIDYYAAIDMDGLPRIIDAVGGVDVYNPRYINDSVTHLTMAAGPVHLDGKTALKYVRTRENGGSDYLRASRQQQVLLALKGKVLSGSGLSRFNTVLSIVGKVVATDFPLKNAKNYVSVGRNLTKIDTCVLGPPYSYHPDVSQTRGMWVSHLDYSRVAGLSVYEFGAESTYYYWQNVTPKGC